VVTGGRDLLTMAALAFGLLCLFNGVATFLRAIVQSNINSLLSWDMGLRVFRHMIRLPLEWFQQRKLADILSRLSGVDQIRNALSSVLSALFDGLLAIALLIAIALLSPVVLWVALISLAINLLVRFIAIPVGHRLNSRAVLAAVGEQGKRMETLRSIQSIKSMAGELARESDWSSRFAEMLQASRDYAIFNLSISAIISTISGIAVIVVIYLSANAVMAGASTIGIMTASIAYLTQFNQSASNVFQQFIYWRMLDVQLERLADVVLEPTEKGIDQVSMPGEVPLTGKIELEGVSFRYGPTGPLLFQDLNLKIEAGEHIAIVGASGAGKSTLVKVIVGLYRPTAGTIRMDGQSTDTLGPRRVRSTLGSVMQDDQLLLGSIAENVSFFADRIDVDRVWSCLRAAAVEDDVRGFPMSIDTLVGDMGSTLSGGQKQRVLIARALYRNPKILVMDEATSHLDIGSERTVIEALSQLGITRIVVAHRQETIAAAGRVLRLESGTLVEER
jgi:ATP-binding cassette subfamily B protein RaxB